MSASTHGDDERLSAPAGSGRLVEVAEELRRMASVLGSTIEGKVCELAAVIVARSGKQAVENAELRGLIKGLAHVIRADTEHENDATADCQACKWLAEAMALEHSQRQGSGNREPIMTESTHNDVERLPASAGYPSVWINDMAAMTKFLRAGELLYLSCRRLDYEQWQNRGIGYISRELLPQFREAMQAYEDAMKSKDND